VTFAIANVGNGVAMLESVSATSGIGKPKALFPPAVLPGDRATIRLAFRFGEAIVPGERIRTLVVYYGAADTEPRRIEFDLLSLRNELWEVTIISVEPRLPRS
jgi:hypothetical protein